MGGRRWVDSEGGVDLGVIVERWRKGVEDDSSAVKSLSGRRMGDVLDSSIGDCELLSLGPVKS